MLKKPFALVLALAALAGGCDDIENSPTLPRASKVLQASAAQYVDDRAVEDRFTLDVDVSGSLKPGHPVHLTLRGKANFATGDAEVRLTLPEVAAAEQSSWDVVELPVGEESRPHIRVRRAFAAGEQFAERTTITIPEAGYYYVVATAKQHSDDRLTDRPYQVTDVSTRTMWVWIDEHGGRVTEQFDSTVFSANDRRERGPRASKYKPSRVRRKGDLYIACTVSPSPEPEVTIQACPTTGGLVVNPPPTTTSATHAFRVTYDNLDAGHAITPLVGVQVGWTIKTSSGGVVSSSSGWSDASGSLPVIDCQGSSTERSILVSVYIRNERAAVKYHQSEAGGGYSGPCGGTTELRADPLMAHLFTNLVKTAEGHQVRFGAFPTRIYAGMYDEGKTYYDFAHPDGELHIFHWGTMVWGSYGALVSAHEYGHHFQDRTLYQPPALNGLIRYYGRECPEAHAPEGSTSFGCAWGEGFADWYAVLVLGSATGSWLTSLETGSYYKNCTPSWGGLRGEITCGDDGSIIEGAIASLLWDLTDGIGTESHDGLQLTPRAVVEAIKTCGVHPASRTYQDRIPYTGIDHLIYCWENRSPYEIDFLGVGVRTFFNTRPRTDWPDRVLGSAIVSGDDRFRRLWLVNLYSKRPEVGAIPIFRELSPVDPPYIEEPQPEPEPCYSNGLEIVCSPLNPTERRS